MKDLLTPEVLAALSGLLHEPSALIWAVLIVVALFGLAKVFTGLAELIKLFK